MAREGTLVVRPDSGDPPTTALKVLELLGEKFGAPENAKGFKTLDSHVRVIWGDGIDYEVRRDDVDTHGFDPSTTTTTSHRHGRWDDEMRGLILTMIVSQSCCLDSPLRESRS